MIPFRLSTIVEGHGEVEALPRLIRRVARELPWSGHLLLNPPLRVPRDRFIRNTAEFERYVELAARRTQGRGAVLILLDAEEDCPARLGPELLNRACQFRHDVPLAVVMPKRKFEAWFVAAAPSLGGVENLPQSLQPEPDPESLSDPKQWLAEQMRQKYIEPRHQPIFAARMDLNLARRAPSFDKLCRDLARLLTSAPAPTA